MPTVLTKLNFFDPHVEPSTYRWSASRESERPINNRAPDSHDVVIHDLRGVSTAQRGELGLTLETAGFEVLQGWGQNGESIAKGWADKCWEDEKWIETEYYSYIRQLLTNKFNASEIFVYDHTIRQRPFPPQETEDLPPAAQTHIDQTYWAAIERVRMYLGEDAAQQVIDGSAGAIICNVWRPLVGPVLQVPLTAADYRTLDDKKTFEGTLPPGPGCRTGESQMLRFHPDQKWYYISKMQTDECLLLKCFDSLTGVRSPHSAFEDPETPPNAGPNRSIEVRTVSLIRGG